MPNPAGDSTPYLLELQLGLPPGVGIGIEGSEEQRPHVSDIHLGGYSRLEVGRGGLETMTFVGTGAAVVRTRCNQSRGIRGRERLGGGAGGWRWA